MKKLISTITLVYTLIAIGISQCPGSGTARLETQQDVDDFVANYPNCTVLTRDLDIGYNPWSSEISDITDLSGLSMLERVEGDLYIGNTGVLLDVTGLENIRYIGKELYVDENLMLRNLSALSNLDSIGEDFFVSVNDSLETVAEFENLSHIGGFIQINFNRNMKTMGSFPKITKVHEHLEVRTAPLLEELAFNNVESVGGRLAIANTNIKDLKGLESLTEVVGQYGYINIDGNQALESLDGLEKLTTVDSRLGLSGCPNLQSLEALSNLQTIGADLNINGCGMENLNGLQKANIGESLFLNYNNNLVSLEGLKASQTIKEDVQIDGNDILVDITYFNQVDSIIGDVKFRWNESLADCEALCRLLDSGYIGGSVSISSNEVGCSSIEEISDGGCAPIGTDNDGDGVTIEDGDCDDTNENIYPGATEICDDIDNDCDGQIDEGLPLFKYFEDMDGDEYGSEVSIEICDETAPAGYTLQEGDCDDSNAAINPEGIEIPNNDIDEDCDGMDEISSTHDLANSSVSIYPNPAIDLIYIETSNLDNYTIDLFDINGKSLINTSNKKQINVGHLLMGTYILQITDIESGERAIERIVKKQ